MADTHRSRLAVISGGGSGIGLASAQRLAADGMDVLLLDIGDRAETAAASVRSSGRVLHAAADVTDRASIDAALAGHSVVDVVVHSAGRFWTKSLAEIEADDFRQMFDVNAIGAVNMVQACLQRFPEGGRIINIASRAFLGSANRAHYVAAKAALVGLTRAMAIELAGRSIAVNAIAPGLVRTNLFEGITAAEVDGLARQYPGGRAADAEDIAHIVAFLADERTKFINGQVLVADAGRSAGVMDPWLER